MSAARPAAGDTDVDDEIDDLAARHAAWAMNEVQRARSISSGALPLPLPIAPSFSGGPAPASSGSGSTHGAAGAAGAAAVAVSRAAGPGAGTSDASGDSPLETGSAGSSPLVTPVATPTLDPEPGPTSGTAGGYLAVGSGSPIVVSIPPPLDLAAMELPPPRASLSMSPASLLSHMATSMSSSTSSSSTSSSSGTAASVRALVMAASPSSVVSAAAAASSVSASSHASPLSSSSASPAVSATPVRPRAGSNFPLDVTSPAPVDWLTAAAAGTAAGGSSSGKKGEGKDSRDLAQHGVTNPALAPLFDAVRDSNIEDLREAFLAVAGNLDLRVRNAVSYRSLSSSRLVCVLVSGSAPCPLTFVPFLFVMQFGQSLLEYAEALGFAHGQACIQAINLLLRRSPNRWSERDVVTWVRGFCLSPTPAVLSRFEDDGVCIGMYIMSDDFTDSIKSQALKKSELHVILRTVADLKTFVKAYRGNE